MGGISKEERLAGDFFSSVLLLTGKGRNGNEGSPLRKGGSMTGDFFSS